MDGIFVEFEVDTKDINIYYEYPRKSSDFQGCFVLAR